MGEKVAKQVEMQMGLYPAPAANKYVKQVGSRLVTNLDSDFKEFSFQILDQMEPNAFAAPGGYIFVSRGILVLLDSEAELAGVLGHEISHVTQRHSYQKRKRSVFSSIIKVPGNIVGSVLGEGIGNVINSPWEALGANYSRKQEAEADEIGMRLAGQSGYDPLELGSILGRMQDEIEALTDETVKHSFFDSHPSTPKRRENIKKESAKISYDPGKPIAKTRKEFLKKFDGMHFDQNPAQGVFQGNKFLHSELSFAINFPENWKTSNTPLMVGGFTPNGDAFIVLGLDDDEADPVSTGEKFDAYFRKRGVTPLESKAIKREHWSGYLIALEDYSKSGPTIVTLLWVKMEGKIFKIFTNGTERFQRSIEKSIYSLHPITESG